MKLLLDNQNDNKAQVIREGVENNRVYNASSLRRGIILRLRVNVIVIFDEDFKYVRELKTIRIIAALRSPLNG